MNQLTICTSCGVEFTCGIEVGNATCWCMELPPVMMVPEKGVTCLCKKCLGDVISVRQKPAIT